MINHLHGRLVEKNPAYIIIECAGVGYFVNISLNTYSAIPDKEECKVFTHLQINEDAHTLFGFADEDERKLFRNLISVSGVGASTARMILSSMNPAEILSCIVNADVVRLKTVKGIGEKTAQRMILELKDKLKKDGPVKSIVSHLKIKDEAMSALLTLGFGRQAVDKTVDQILRDQPTMSVEDLIRKALKTM
ncbi:MAG: Holliday junction branch migration protein RuvA [Bacteroidota bacterium]